MDQFFLIILILSSFYLVYWGLRRRSNRLYQFPFLAGAIFICWFIPQAVGLLGDTRLPVGGYASTMFMAILCVWAIYFGYYWRPRSIRFFAWHFDDRRLLYAAAGMSLFGSFFALKIRGLPEEMLTAAWTGLPVAYLFFAQTQIYGYAIAALLFARKRSVFALAIIVYNFSFFIVTIIIGGRRGFTAEIVLITLLAFWFSQRWIIPRAVMIGAIIVGGLVVNSIGDYRGITHSGSYGGRSAHLPGHKDIFSIDYIGNFKEILNDGGHEIRNTIFNIAAINKTLEFDFGLSYWNALVFRYVPAQLVGRGFKDSLIVDLPDTALHVYQYIPNSGSTLTGLSDTFRAFWYLGAFVFFFISRVMRSLYISSLRGHTIAQLAYMLIITDALLAITHESYWFFVPWVHFGIFLLPVLMWARSRKNAGSRSTPAMDKTEF